MERILLVEDDRSIATLFGLVLRRSGFEVLQARCASEAVRLGRIHGHAIGLLLSDVLLDRETAAPLVADLRELCPALPVLFISGYSREALVDLGFLDENAFRDNSFFFIQKPISPEDLTRAVREILGSVTADKCASHGGVQ